ncbi:PE-PPE domain-containing protein [Gordonia sp. (in: high G+C Gram-positive bacteria)]|uniref:PE-PPE domain-containing protein n=1 Tax=Gordonia sp. (in: high G+C Gram-positive bacteria) TaxID=84139 RepID=UPI003C790DD2
MVATREVTVLAVGGTGESFTGDTGTRVRGMLQAVTDRLDDRFDARWVGYPSSYGPAPTFDGISYADSVSAGVAALAEAIAATEGPVMLIGYSQGAAVIRTLIAHPSAFRLLERVAAVGFVADPNQPRGAVAGCPGWGVAGPGGGLPEDLPAYWVGAASDVICNASEDSLIRDIADLTDSLSLTQVRRSLTDATARVMSRRMQNADATRVAPAQWRRDLTRLRTAAREVAGYLPSQIELGRWRLSNRSGGRHVSYATEPYRRAPLTDPEVTGCQTLAHWLQLQATMGELDRSVRESGQQTRSSGE